jgi:SagB-type dehydrogenase family enzyme
LHAELVSGNREQSRETADPPPNHAGYTGYTLSRFAYVRRDGDRFILESPRASSYIILHDAEALAQVSKLDDPDFVALLAQAGMLANADGPELPNWSFHDLVFHSRHRADPTRTGGEPPEPVVKPQMSNRMIALDVPDMSALINVDYTLTWALETRRSVREYGKIPITLQNLSEFLFRAARITETHYGDPYDATRRPYPSAGATYALEIYAVVRRCEGLDRGIYHYDPMNHALEVIDTSSKPSDPVNALLNYAMDMTGTTNPHVLLHITARFGRVNWKYPTNAFALILKDFGCLLQTMYLVAAAMNLAGCAIGSDDPAIFASATGIDPTEEASVGGFWLGA